MVREAWNSVHAVHKQVVQGANLRKQCFKGVFRVKVWKSFLILTNINYINWITGIEFHKLEFWRFTYEIIVSFTNVKNLTTFGGNPVKISCARYWWSVYLVIFRNKAFKFSFCLWEPKSALWTGREGGYKEGGGGMSNKRFYINVSFNTWMHTSHRDAKQV